MRFPRVAKAQPWARVGERFQRYSFPIKLFKSGCRFAFCAKPRPLISCNGRACPKSRGIDCDALTIMLNKHHSVATRRRCRWLLLTPALKGWAKVTPTLRVEVLTPNSGAKPQRPHRDAKNRANPSALVIKSGPIKQDFAGRAPARAARPGRRKLSTAGNPSITRPAQLVTPKHLPIFHDREVK